LVRSFLGGSLLLIVNFGVKKSKVVMLATKKKNRKGVKGVGGGGGGAML